MPADRDPALRLPADSEVPGVCPGLVRIPASDLAFNETVVRPDGKPGRRGHYYLWARCGICGEPQLVRRAGLSKRRCVMTPKCRGLLAPADDALDFGGPVGLAVGAFGAAVLAVHDEEVAG